MATMSNKPSALADRRIIEFAGPDTSALLQRVITCDVQKIESGQILPGALLTPQGKVIVDFLVHGFENGAYLDVWHEAADSLAKRLTLYRLRAKVDIRVADNMAVFSGAGTNDPRSDDLPPRLVSEAVDSASDKAGTQAALEIALGIPAFGRDYRETEVFPTDVNLDLYGGIAWKKGCFIGQEVLSRMKRRGTIRKRTVKIESDAPGLAVGTELTAGGKPAGSLTSVNGKTALAIVRIDRLEDAGGQATVNGHPVRVSVPQID